MFSERIPMKRFWPPRFRLTSLFWLVLCIAGVLGAYRAGHQVGYDKGRDPRSNVGRLQTCVYNVGDLVAGPNVDSFISGIKATILPNTWDTYGGKATISQLEPNQCIVVSHDVDGQCRVADFLSALREEDAARLDVLANSLR
jgi:hypothetical protein